MSESSQTDDFSFCTVRIETPKSVGTGFVFSYQLGEKVTDFIVTNKHVVFRDDVISDVGHLFFTKRGDNNEPILGSIVPVELTDFQAGWYGHPDSTIDIAVTPLTAKIDEINRRGVRVYISSLGNNHVMSDDQIKDLMDIEDIIFIGYPMGIFDKINFTPLVRRGITSTPIRLDYNGKPQFLVDAAVFGGSSGSPVLIYNQHSYRTKSGTHIGSARLVLVGVLAEVLTISERNLVEVVPIATEPIATEPKLAVTTSHRMGLGVVYKTSTVIECIEAALRGAGYL